MGKLVSVSLAAFLFLVLIGSSFVFLFVLTVSADLGVSPNSVTKMNGTQAAYEVLKNSGGASSGSLMVSGTWVVPQVKCLSAGVHTMEYRVELIVGSTDGADMFVECSSMGGTPSYQLGYINQGSGSPTGLTIFPGNVIKSTTTFSYLTDAVSIKVKDFTTRQSFTSPALTDSPTAFPGAAWLLVGTETFLSLQFSTLKTSGDKATIGTHSGTLGSFSTLSGYSVQEFIYVDPNNGNILARSSFITSTSSSFSIKWLRES